MRAILRFLFYLLYHPLAWSYDLVAGAISLGRWNEWIRCVIPLVQGRIILELGFGPGHLQMELSQKSLRVYGLDESVQMVHQASRRLRKNRVPVNLARGLSQHLPFQSAFDTVIATFPSEYIFDSNTIKEIYRVLVPGGKFIILLSVLLGNPNFSVKAISWLLRITGQGKMTHRENRINKISRLFVKEGFIMETRYLSFRSISLLVLYGEKPGDAIQ
jgi:ubiquinone/menaquinone biosynthesis C-methylase UbiE